MGIIEWESAGFVPGWVRIKYWVSAGMLLCNRRDWELEDRQ